MPFFSLVVAAQPASMRRRHKGAIGRVRPTPTNIPPKIPSVVRTFIARSPCPAPPQVPDHKNWVTPGAPPWTMDLEVSFSSPPRAAPLEICGHGNYPGRSVLGGHQLVSQACTPPHPAPRRWRENNTHLLFSLFFFGFQFTHGRSWRFRGRWRGSPAAARSPPAPSRCGGRAVAPAAAAPPTPGKN